MVYVSTITIDFISSAANKSNEKMLAKAIFRPYYFTINMRLRIHKKHGNKIYLFYNHYIGNKNIGTVEIWNIN